MHKCTQQSIIHNRHRNILNGFDISQGYLQGLNLHSIAVVSNVYNWSLKDIYKCWTEDERCQQSVSREEKN